MKEQSAQARWGQVGQRPLPALAVAFAVAYALPIADSSAGHVPTSGCTVAEWAVWGAHLFRVRRPAARCPPPAARRGPTVPHALRRT